ncbi:PspC domain-containing protein [Kineococcus gynurae]|uniref:PspC domain-containing protein n=1 Tax=Kineococcus gynurae TaxID=452979 RepID=A0ABV5LSG6_9ACTN
MTEGSPTPGASTPTGAARFFGTVRSWGVRRDEDRWFVGVCGGVAQRFGVDPLVVRGVLVAVTLVGGVGLLLYGLAWALLPDGRPGDRQGRIEAEAAVRGDVSGGLVAAGGLVLTDLVWQRGILGLGWGAWDGRGWGFLVTGAAVVLGWWLLRGGAPGPRPEPAPGPGRTDPPTAPVPVTPPHPVDLRKPPTGGTPLHPPAPFAGHGSATERTKAERQTPPTPPRPPRPGSPLLTSFVLGSALLAVGGCVLAERLGVLPGGPGALVPLAGALVLALLGLGAVLAGVRGRTSALVGFGWPVALVALAASVLPGAENWHWQRSGVWTPTAASQAAEPAWSAVAGDLRVDPSRLPGAAGPAVATVAAGTLVVEAPRSAAVLVEVFVGAGGITVPVADDVVRVGATGSDDAPVRYGEVTDGGIEGVLLRPVFAVGPGARDLAAATVVRGDDPARWQVPDGTGVLQARAWAGEVEIRPGADS